MKLEQDLENDPIEKKPMIPDPAVSPSNKGFDFSVPSVSHEGFNFTTQNYTPDTAESIDSCNTNPFVFGSYNQHDSPGKTVKINLDVASKFLLNIMSFRERPLHVRKS